MYWIAGRFAFVVNFTFRVHTQCPISHRYYRTTLFSSNSPIFLFWSDTRDYFVVDEIHCCCCEIEVVDVPMYDRTIIEVVNVSKAEQIGACTMGEAKLNRLNTMKIKRIFGVISHEPIMGADEWTKRMKTKMKLKLNVKWPIVIISCLECNAPHHRHWRFRQIRNDNVCASHLHATMNRPLCLFILFKWNCIVRRYAEYTEAQK